MMADKPEKPKMVAPIEKLKEVVQERVDNEVALEARWRAAWKRPKQLSKRDQMTAPQRRTFIDECLKEDGKYRAIVTNAEPCETRQERVIYIAELMASGQWRTAMVTVLSKVWGAHEGLIRQISAEASRHVRLSMGSKEQLRTTAMAFLDNVARDAHENGDYRSTIAAVRTFSDIAGLIITKHEMSGANGGPIRIMQELKCLSDEALDREILKAAAIVVKEQNGGDLGEQAKLLLEAVNVVHDAEFEPDE